ncbi:MAG: DUF2062 domain-containing protein [Chitinivibrionales bacterium]|nr:DUF2062 domain-containing protein [Chitinivibrionales bacterium]MBD3394448.1 DUF2062 domain-containing protein [Chitinivibrionales bacterium]
MNEQSPSRETVPVRIAALIPAYNNAGTLGDVIDGAVAIVHAVIVVDDGSTDSTPDLLQKRADAVIIRFERNRGKGCALRAGMDRAREMGFSHVITIDGDGQHKTADLHRFVHRIHQEPDTLWIGNRTLPSEGDAPPPRSTFGRKFGNFWYRFNTGVAIHDTQCGFRAYPLRELEKIRIRGTRYEFEQDVLIKADWNGIAVKEVDVTLNYQPAATRISHFRPVRDFLRISVVNGRAAFVRIVFPVFTFEAPGATLREKIRAVVRHELRAHTTPKRAAFSIALGVFMGIFPIHGFQVVTLMGLTVVLGLNRPLAFLGVCVSSPPFLPFLIVAAVAIGRLVVPTGIVAKASSPTLTAVLQGGLEFVAGSVILAVLSGAAVFAVLYPLFARLGTSRVFSGRRK